MCRSHTIDTYGLTGDEYTVNMNNCTLRVSSIPWCYTKINNKSIPWIDNDFVGGIFVLIFTYQ